MQPKNDMATEAQPSDDGVSVLLATLSRMAKVIATEFSDVGEAEREAYTRIVSACASRCFDAELSGPHGSMNAIAATLWAEVVEHKRNPRVELVPAAPWLAQEHLAAMRVEAEQLASEPGHGPGNYPNTVTAGPAAARLFAGNDAFFAWASEAMGVEFRRELTLNYLNYNHAGHHCEAHLDQPQIFEFNCLICLEHEVAEGHAAQTQLRLYANNKWLCYRVPVGGALMFHSSSTIHGRTPVGHGETLKMLSVGLCAR
jgi:hypothetical protein